MRVTTAFNRLLRLRGASVIDVSFTAEGVIVTVRLRRRRRVCARCGQTGSRLVVHDRRVKRWRHLDLGSTRCVIECELRLLRCPDCRVVRAEPVPWARAGAHHTMHPLHLVQRSVGLVAATACAVADFECAKRAFEEPRSNRCPWLVSPRAWRTRQFRAYP